MNKAYLVTKCFIKNEDSNILVLKRGADAQVRPGQWDLPGGMIEEGEDPNKAVLREIKEETAIDLGSASVFYISSEDAPAYILTFFYYYKYEGHDVKISKEHSRYKWISIPEFNKLELPEKFKVASMHLRQSEKDIEKG